MIDSKDFVTYPIRSVHPERPLPADIYFYIAGKYIKYLQADDSLSSKKLDYLLLKKCQFIFIKKADLSHYEDWSDSIRNEMRDEMKDDFLLALGGNCADLLEVAEEKVKVRDTFEDFISKDVTDQSVKELIKSTKSFIGTMKRKGTGESFLMQLSKLGDQIADHSMSVASISTYLASSIGFNSPEALEDVYLGGLLHDFGKTRVNQKHIDQPKTNLAKQAMKKHPSLGKTALLLEDGFNDNTLRIIAEHHERNDGKGYPKGMMGKKIFDLTKIVSIANSFDKIVKGGSGTHAEKQRAALNKLKEDKGRHFDPQVLAQCLKAIDDVI